MSLSSIIINDGLRDIQNKTNPYGVARRLVMMIVQYRIYDNMYEGIETGFLHGDINDRNAGRALRHAAKGNQLDLCENLILLRGDIGYGLQGAAESHNMKLIEWFIEKGAIDMDHGLWGAAEGGHIDLVEWFVKKGAIICSWGLLKALAGGNKDIIANFITKATLFDYHYEYVIEKKNFELLEYLLHKRDHFSRICIKAALETNNWTALRYLMTRKDFDISDVPGAIAYSIQTGNFEMFKYLKDKIPYHPRTGMIDAIKYNRGEMIEYFISEGADDWYRYRETALFYNNEYWSKYFLDKIHTIV